MRLLPRRRWSRIALAVLSIVMALLAADLVVLSNRVTAWDVTLPAQQDDVDTWVIVGSDSRAHLPGQSRSDQFGTQQDVPGERADIIIVLTIRDGEARGVSIPRDLLVQDRGYPKRVGMTLLDGPQHLLDALCTSLQIPADHLVGLHFDGFVRMVDILGGIDVTLEHPLRDPVAGLDLANPGPQRLGGAQALALVRSRHTEMLVDGTWRPVEDGAGERSTWAGTVLKAVIGAVRDHRFNPVTMQRLAWVATGALRTDPDTGLFDLAALAKISPTITSLPHGSATGTPAPDGVLPLPPNADTARAVTQLGLGKKCPTG